VPPEKVAEAVGNIFRSEQALEENKRRLFPAFQYTKEEFFLV